MTLQSRKIWNFENAVLASEIQSILKKRGVNDIESFLNPKLSDIYDCTKLFDSKRAAKAILKSIEENKKIYIHGDFDSDGVCATAILWDFLYKELSEKLGKKVDVVPYIPSRVDEGYGLSDQSVQTMIEGGASLVITVDCGIRDRELIEKYIEQGLEIIVTDHHQPPEDITKAKYPIVHPMFPGNEYPFEKICGSTVAFLLTQAIRKEAGLEYEITKETKGLDLVALATVTDMMPLIDVNRVLVKFGLEQMTENTRLGIQALLNLADVEINKLDSYHFGFVIGPRLNAAGRIGHAMDSLRLLVAPNQKSAMEYSSVLHNLNLRRQENTQDLIIQAESLLPDFESESLIFIHGTNWHEGVIGLVAGKIFEKTGKPTIIATTTEKETKASARSISTFNITEVLEIHSDHLVKYGGHAQAAGFTIKEGRIDDFKVSILKYAKENIKEEDLKATLDIDIKFEPSEVSLQLYNDIESLKPFGYGNPKPFVMMEGLEIIDKKEMSNGKHMKLRVRKDQVEISLLMFNCSEDIPLINIGDTIDVVGNLSINEWKERINIEIIVKEYKL